MSYSKGFPSNQPNYSGQSSQFNAGPQSVQSGHYPPQHQAGQYPPQQPAGQYPPQQPAGQYPPQQPAGQYPPQQPAGQYPPQQQAGQYPPQQQAGQYPPQQPAGQYPPQQPGGYPTKQPVQSSMGGAWDPSHAKQYEGEIPEHDVDENSAQEPSLPSAPPPVEVALPGYEGVAYATENPVGPPPVYTETIQDTRIDTSVVPSITAEDAKEALKEYVSQQCCYGSGAAEEMSIKDIRSSSAFHYSLETFTESRTTSWHHLPYSGGLVDGPHMGPAPGPWDISCSFAQLFTNEVKKLEVPHTASVRPCHVCFGRGFERCWRCLGRGRVRCSFCHGKGRRTEFQDGQQRQVSCSSCNGSGRKRCFTCSGFGCVKCRECKGFGQIKQFIQLTVTFKNEVSDHIVERTMMPDELIREAAGDTILEQVAIRVGPVVGFFDSEINQRSYTIVQQHASSWPNSRIIQQRQRLRGVPVYECDFKFNDEMGKFWVYGKQRAVYTTDYPHTCCCCKCVIL